MPFDRLRSGRDIAAVFAARSQRGGRLLVVHLRCRGSDTGPPRVAVVASRKVGGAVARNRAKRLLRVAASQVGLPDGTDVVLVAKAATPAARASDVTAELAELFAALQVAGVRR